MYRRKALEKSSNYPVWLTVHLLRESGGEPEALGYTGSLA